MAIPVYIKNRSSPIFSKLVIFFTKHNGIQNKCVGSEASGPIVGTRAKMSKDMSLASIEDGVSSLGRPVCEDNQRRTLVMTSEVINRPALPFVAIKTTNYDVNILSHIFSPFKCYLCKDYIT